MSYFKYVFGFTLFLLDLLVPRFIREPVACKVIFNEKRQMPELHPVCPIIDLMPQDDYDVIVWMKSFTWLNYCFFPKYDGDYEEEVK